MKFIDLFADCGGMTLGFQNAGFEAVAAFDNWEPAVRVYRANFAHDIHKLDLSDWQESLMILDSYQFDMIIGGPPCQDFSHAGKRNENLGRADLTISFAQIVAHTRPQWFVMENVDRTVKSQRYRQAGEILRGAGYSLTQRILDANQCGVPQKRKRLFLIGELGLSPSVDSRFLASCLDNNLVAEPMTVRDYFGDSLDIAHYYRHPRNYSRRAVFSVDEPSPTVRGVNRPIPKTYKTHPKDTAPVSKEVRPLTTLERSYLQTFPKSFHFDGSKTDLEQMIGNAVPVKQAEYIARCIDAYISEKRNPSDSVQQDSIQLLLFRESRSHSF
ncbi:MAG: DNA cytosine methyltransferase [Candidatus Poribacteria bacterium]|nr:DNA cytosine methyltransferase [Candidatus Poribacteria bacterium]